MNRNHSYSQKSDIPTHWYNIMADYPEFYVPHLDSTTHQPVNVHSLSNIFPELLAEQEINRKDVNIPIPPELLDYYAMWRPSPLIRARNLEKYLDTNCKIFYKYEGVSPIGSHKANSAIAQAYFSKKCGFTNVVAETGAGQWGSAMSMASSFFDLNCNVFMVKNSFDSKPQRRILMQTYGSKVHSSPSNLTEFGRQIRKNDPDSQGSLGIAIAEAVEYASSDRNTVYTLGSSMNFVCLHQTIIGNELKNQLNSLQITPNYIISCIGGGSSFAGICFPFLREKLERNRDLHFIAVESNAVPTVTKGIYTYDYGDTARLTPLSKMYTLGHEFSAPVIHSGGLRYHGLSPLVSKFIADGHAEARAYSQLDIYGAARLFAKLEGYVPAPESAHSVKAAIDVALENRNSGKTIVFCLTGHGFFDLAGYEKFNAGKMEDSESPDTNIHESLRKLAHTVRPETEKGAALPPQPPLNAGVQANNSFEAWWNRNFESQSPADSFQSGHTIGSAGASPKTACGREQDKGNPNLYNLLTESKVRELIDKGQKVAFLSKGCVITPLAGELIKSHGIEIKYA
ncbi:MULTISPECIES: TrpB-like pyridoxal phosphate-dependent enzyme [Paenibacillus]|uniref:tryptophan synthase n=1 Tax=Paenibacillus borealis TaxID=160799 RepID=A0ABX3H3S9_PAEBO|nr:TrpB-like pyridoxal phosphate-dependent enzyme [Paenibacillus borealis]OMD45067.1 TrpB-like pyridoxal-phosphate dependent enzyme [Paenibacillus borealis]